MKEFNLYVMSPFFNKNKNVIKLFGLLNNEFQEFKEHRIKKEYLFKQIFPQEEYNEENIKTIIYLLTRLAEKYMAYQKFIENPLEERYKLLASLDKRKLDKQFHKYERRTEDELSEIKGIDLECINEKISFGKIRSSFYSERNYDEIIYQTELKTAEQIISAFFIEIFRKINLLDRTEYLNFPLGINFAAELMNNINFTAFIQSLQKQSFENLPVLEVYYNMYNFLKETVSNDYYLKFKKSFHDNAKYLGKSEQYILSTLMVNSLHYKHMENSIQYGRELFEAYKILLNLYDYSGDRYLRSVIYTNVLRLAVQCREFKWTENYIKEYSDKLPPEHKVNMMYYSLAYLSFAKGEFEKTLEYASKINFSTFQMKYYLRNLQLSSLYELAEFEGALNMIDAYKHFIRKEKNFSAKLKQSYMEFISYVNELIKVTLGENKTGIAELKQRISGSNSMRKQWLLDKVNELK
jgi:hypothetical protein